MQIEIQSRRFNLGEEQKEKIEEMLAKLERFSPRPPKSVRLNLTHEGNRFTADMVFALRSTDFRTKVDAPEPELATDAAVENIRTQLQKYKGKISGRQQGEQGGLGRAALADVPGDAIDAAGAAVQSEGFSLRDLTVEGAMEQFKGSAHPFYVFRNSETDRVSVVYTKEDGEYGLMEATEE